jgi:hypothetical protein
MKNSNDTIGNRTRDLPACSTVPQPTAPPRTPGVLSVQPNLEDKCLFLFVYFDGAIFEFLTHPTLLVNLPRDGKRAHLRYDTKIFGTVMEDVPV